MGKGRGCRKRSLATKKWQKWRKERGYYELMCSARHWLEWGVKETAVSCQKLAEMGKGEVQPGDSESS